MALRHAFLDRNGQTVQPCARTSNADRQAGAGMHVRAHDLQGGGTSWQSIIGCFAIKRS